MHLCTAKIMLGADAGQILHRQAHNPLSWPEIGLLQWMHGEESVFDVEVCGETEATRAGEKARLVEKYGRDVVEMVYPGRAPMLEMEMPGVTSMPKPKKAKAVRTVPVQPTFGRDAKRPDPIPAPEPYSEDV